MAEIEGLDTLLRRISELSLDTRRVERPLEAVGALMLSSVEKNFQQQGRPDKWSPLSPRTLAGRRKGRGKGGPKILIDRARLKNSMGYRVHLALPDSSVEVGTNVVYGPRHHFGYEGGEGRGRSKTPARPFLLIQDEDVRDMREILSRHISR